jgi:hypothetical protein
MLTRCCAAAVAVLVLLTSTARAQGRPVELGIDAGGSLDLSSGNAVVVGVPVQDFRGLNFLKIGSESDTQLALGGALGVKIPIGERLATRLEGSFTHGFESSGSGGGSALGLTVGLSFYTR